MEKRTFKKGVHPPHNKLTAELPLEDCPAPDTVRIALLQHIGKPCAPVVAPGDRVRAGTLIGSGDGLCAAVFSSVSGTVKAIERHKTPTGACEHVVIENDGRYETESLPPLKELTRESIVKRIKDAGIVGMGGAGFPSHVKYAPQKAVDTFILNAAECEPYITCDNRLLVEHAKEVLGGAAMLATALGLDRFFIGIEDNKTEVARMLDGIDAGGMPFETVLLKTKYPQGAEKQLIYAVTGRKVPRGGLPADVGAVVGNVHTAYAMYDAAVNGTPLYRRAMTVGGDVAQPKNLWVRNGTPYSVCAELCGGCPDSVKTVSGGPMMGFALPDTDYYTTKTTGALLFLNGADANTQKPSPCINCAKCAGVCPMNLMPMYIDAYALRGDFASAKKYGALDCMECGCCAYTCPAKRPIVQSVRLAKRKIKELKI